MLITFGSEKVTEFMVPQRPCGIKSSEFHIFLIGPHACDQNIKLQLFLFITLFSFLGWGWRELATH